MLDWEGRILDNRSIRLIKAALPFLDLPVGSKVDLEGLLRAVRDFCHQKEQRWVDMMLNLFQMKRMMAMMNVMNEVKERPDSEQGMETVLELLKGQMPPEQQGMFDMMSMMMMAMDDGSEPFGENDTPHGEGESETGEE